MAKPGNRVYLTLTARADLFRVMEWSVKEFGDRAALRYDALIKQALRDIEEDPERPGSTEKPELMIEGGRTYHLSFSRGRLPYPGVKEPRHFLLYRRRGNVIEVARILHDARDLKRNLPEAYRR